MIWKEVIEDIGDKENLNIKWKQLIRKGVPNEYMRKVILNLFNIDEVESKHTYQTVIRVLYKVLIYIIYYI